MPKQESHLFVYPRTDATTPQLPDAVFIKLPGFGSVPCKVERMDEDEIAQMFGPQGS